MFFQGVYLFAIAQGYEVVAFFQNLLGKGEALAARATRGAPGFVHADDYGAGVAAPTRWATPLTALGGMAISMAP